MGNQRGVSYIQILLASSAIGALAAIGIKLMRDQQRIAAMAFQDFQISYIVQEINYILSSSNSCNATLQGIPIQKKKAIESIKKRTVGSLGQSQSIHSLFKAGSPAGSYAVSKLSLVSYDLEPLPVQGSDSSEFVNLSIHFDKGDAILGERKVKREIPIKIKLDENKLIVGCQAKSPQDVGGQHWKSLPDGSWQLEGKRLGVNISPVEDASIHLRGGIQLLEDLKQVCNEEFSGALRWNGQKKRHEFCGLNGKWSVLGRGELDTKNYTVYEGKLKQPGTEKVESRPHHYCVLQSIEKSLRDGECRVSKKIEEGKSIYTLFLTSSASLVNQKCIMYCYD